MDIPVSLVTGAARGIGLEVVRQLALRGHCVLLAARNADRGQAAAQQLSASGHVQFLPLDVTSPSSIEQAQQKVRQEFGRLDVLINNAAILLDHYQKPSETSVQQLQETLQTNVMAVHAMIQAFTPLLKASAAPRIINVSSGAGQLSGMQGSVWAPAYQISKTAVNAVTRVWATELSESNIAVNSVCPGWCRTEMGGEGAPRSPEEGAAGIVWLATEAAHQLTSRFFRDREEIAW